MFRCKGTDSRRKGHGMKKILVLVVLIIIFRLLLVDYVYSILEKIAPLA